MTMSPEAVSLSGGLAAISSVDAPQAGALDTSLSTPSVSRMQRVEPAADPTAGILQGLDFARKPGLDLQDPAIPGQVAAIFQTFGQVTDRVIATSLATTAVSSGVSATKRMHQGQ